MAVARTSIVLFLFWLLLAGTDDLTEVGIGVFVCVSLAWWTSPLAKRDRAPRLTPRRVLGFLGHLVTFVWSVVTGGVQVAIDAVRPHPAIEPRIIEHHTGLEREFSQALYVNTITLSPGTLALESEDGTVLVHCLSTRFAKGLEDGRTEDRIARVFEERT